MNIGKGATGGAGKGAAQPPGAFLRGLMK
jgi:hypothetical protein